MTLRVAIDVGGEPAGLLYVELVGDFDGYPDRETRRVAWEPANGGEREEYLLAGVKRGLAPVALLYEALTALAEGRRERLERARMGGHAPPAVEGDPHRIDPLQHVRREADSG